MTTSGLLFTDHPVYRTTHNAGDHPWRRKRSSGSLRHESRGMTSSKRRRNYLVEMVLVIDYVIYYRSAE